MLAQLKAAWSSLGRNLTPTSPRLISVFSGGETSSGETVSPDAALQLETVWACIRLIALTIATLPCQLHRRGQNGRGSLDANHPLYRLLHDLPNADMTSVVFWEAMVACLLMWGNAYARITRNTIGVIIAITPIRADRVKPQRRSDGSRYYDVTTGGTVASIDESEIMHIKGFSTDGEEGLSIIAQARETLGLALAAEKTAGSLFRNSMRTTFALFLPTVLDDNRRKRFKEEYLPSFRGALNAGRVPVLEGGWEIKNLGLNPADAELLATRSFSIEQICRWFGVQPVMIGHMNKSTAWGTGLEQMNLWFLTYTLRPILKAIEQEIGRSLLTAVEQIRYYAEFNVEGLLRADSAGRAALMKVLVECGLRTPNEQRALDNLAPLPGGDDLYMNSTMLPVRLLSLGGRSTLSTPADPTSSLPANENRGVQNASH